MLLWACLSIAFVLSLPAYQAPAGNVSDLMRQAEAHVQGEQYPLAESVLQQVVRLEPANVQALYRLGYVQYRQRKLVAARQSFAAVVNKAPPAHHSRYFLGRIALLENKPREAIVWLEPVAQSKQSVFDADSQLASAYSAAGEHKSAIPPLRAAIAQAPWDGSLYYRLGQLYRRLGQTELAEEALENSKRLRNASREDVETMVHLSQAIREGKTAEAIQLGAAIVERADADPNALLALGVIYGGADLQAEALRAFELATYRDPNFFQAQFNRGLALLRLGRAPEALAPLSRAVELLPQSVEANMTYGLAGVMSQRYADATAPLERAWKADPSNLKVGALLATAYIRTAAAAKAVPILRNGTDRATTDPAMPLLLVEALNAVEDTYGALEAARLAQRRFPQMPQCHLAVAQQLVRMGSYQEARAAFQETLRLVPGQPEAELGLADTLQKAGEHEQAAGHYRLAMNSPGARLGARVGLARSLIALGRLDEAQKTLEEGIPLHPLEVSLRLELSRVYARLGKSDLAAEQAKIVEQLRAEQSNR